MEMIKQAVLQYECPDLERVQVDLKGNLVIVQVYKKLRCINYICKRYNRAFLVDDETLNNIADGLTKDKAKIRQLSEHYFALAYKSTDKRSAWFYKRMAMLLDEEARY